MNHIFISYSRKDTDVVNIFTEKLRKSGLDVWLDTSGSGTGIPFSTKWFEVIEEALYMSSGAVIFKSNYWESSIPCNKEFNIICKCDIPYLEINPSSVKIDSDSVYTQVDNFICEKVNTQTNNLRTTLFASAYRYKTGTNPYQLIKNTKGFFASLLYTISELMQFRQLITTGRYDSLNPDIFPYIKKFLSFIKRVLIFKVCGIAVGALVALTAINLIFAIPLTLYHGSQQQENNYMGQIVAGRISEIMNIDPLMAIRIIEEMDNKYLVETSYTPLILYGSKLLDSRLPEKVLIAKDNEYEYIKSFKPLESSSFFVAEPSRNSGSILLTELLTGEKWTINTPSLADNISWSNDECIFAYSAGNKIYVYDAVGKGAPMQLSGNYEQISQLKFLEIDGNTFLAAYTEQDTILLWKSPFAIRSSNRKSIEYGVFIKGDEPTVVYVDGKDIIIKKAQKETVISPDIPDTYGEIKVPYYDVTSDGRYIAYICEKDGATRIICVALKDGEIILDIPTKYTATSVAFSEDSLNIYASARGCAIIHVDITSKEVMYGSYDNLYFGNIDSYCDKWLLTDYNGFCCIFDGEMKILKDCGSINYVHTPCFALSINPKNNYFFTVNRGAGATNGCSRFNLKTGEINLFVVPEMTHIDANTAVALSSDGKYVAYGYPNGIIRVYEQKDMHLIFEKKCFGESVSAIQFSNSDSLIYILGATGNIYMYQLPKLELSTNITTMRSNWQTVVCELIRMKEKYYNGISK